jgi:hypothetical protein
VEVPGNHSPTGNLEAHAQAIRDWLERLAD